jgi:hypothetical protein
LRASFLFIFAFIFAGGDALAGPSSAAPQTSLADSTSVKTPLPQRERDYIDIIENARKQYRAARSADGRKDARMTMQIKTHEFMGLSHDARGWVGVFKESKITPLGRRSLRIEIAPGVTIVTEENAYSGDPYDTMVKATSPVGRGIEGLTVGQPVIFDASFIGSRISGDDDMVLQPEIIARFTSLERSN